jgi:nucleoside-diphosphate-sugar epimerase
VSVAERVLVTGGAGFIGSHLVEALLERGYQVRVSDNLTLGRSEWLSPEAEFVESDIRNLEDCRRAAKDCVGVFHMAAMSRSAASLDNVEICTSNNIVGTQNVLTAAREAGCRKVIYAGSSTYYGNQKPPHREEMPPEYLNFYGLSKHVGEEYCQLFDRMYNLPAVVLRYFNVYGPRLSGEGAYALVISIFLRQLNAGQPLTIHGDGEQRRDFVHVRDVARANVLAFESSIRGRTYNVGTGTTVSVKELANLISPLQTHEARRAGDAEVTLADISRIQAELGWQPQISLEAGIKELLDPSQTERTSYAKR